MSRIIICIDMDSFYASVEERDNPELKGKPIAVGAGGNVELGYGAVSTCNYAARKFGVKAGQRLATVRKLCPDCIIIPPRMKHYKEVSDQIMDLLGNYVEHDNLEVRSIDEAFLDITNNVKNFEEAKAFGINIKNEIKSQIGLTATLGISSSKSIAKIASGMNKPDGLTIVTPEEQKEFLKDLPIKKIPGIGKKSAELLKNELGIETIGHLAFIKDTAKLKLKKILGKKGIYFYNIARGIDDSPVKPRSGVKSISNQKTFIESVKDSEKIKETLDILADKIFKRLEKNNLEFKTVTINVPFKAAKANSKSISLKNYTHSLEKLKKTAHQIWDSYFLKEISSIRRISLKISNLRKIKSKQKDLTSWLG